MIYYQMKYKTFIETVIKEDEVHETVIKEDEVNETVIKNVKVNFIPNTTQKEEILEKNDFFKNNSDLFNEFCSCLREYTSKSSFVRGADRYIRRNIEINEFKKLCPNDNLTNEELIRKLEDSNDKYNKLRVESNSKINVLNKKCKLLTEERDDYKNQLDYIYNDELIKNVIEGSKIMKDNLGKLFP